MSKLYLALRLSGLLRLFGYATDPLLDAHEIRRIVGEPTRFGGISPPDYR